jgi:hypothetical protein
LHVPRRTGDFDELITTKSPQNQVAWITRSPPRERFMEVCGMDDAKLFYQMHYPLSPFSEAMRTLRSGIHMSDVDQPPKIIQVT